MRISEFKKKLQKFTVNGRFYVWPWACEDPRWRSRRQRNSSRIPIEIHVGILIWFWSEKNPLCQKIKVLSFLEACLIWSGLPHFPRKFKSWVGKLLKIWGSNPHSGRSKNFCSFFFLFSNSPHKIVYLWSLVLLIRNKIKHVEIFCFYWYLYSDFSI